MDEQAILSVNNLWLHYDGAAALRSVSLAVKEKQIVSVVGANGAGKTSLLMTIAGLLKPTSGEIYWHRERIDSKTAQSTAKIGIRLVPEGRNLFPYMSVQENLAAGAYLCKSKNEVLGNLDLVYSYLPALKARKKQQARTLSGGEQEMLAIGRALMTRPKLLMLDEPSTGLSPLLVEEVAKLIVYLRQQGTGILLVEQNASMALNIADYGYVLEIGKISIEGKAKVLAESELVKKAYLGL